MPAARIDRVKFPLRIVMFFASFVFYSVVADHDSFTSKLFERFPKLKRLGAQKCIKLEVFMDQKRRISTSRAKRLEETGNLSEALAVSGIGNRTRLRKSIGELHLIPSSFKVDHHNAVRQPRGSAEKLTIVAPITNSLPYTLAGYSLRTHELFSALTRLDVSVHALTRPGYPVNVGRLPRQSSEVIDGVNYHRNIPHRFSLNAEQSLKSSSIEIQRLVSKVKADVIHTTSPFINGLAAGEAADALSLPWIYEVRGREERSWLASLPLERQDDAARSERYRLTELQEVRCISRASHVIALSEIMRQEFLSEGVPGDRITVIPNGVDDRIFEFDFSKEDARAKLGLPATRIIGSISSLVRYEGIESLIRSALDLPSDFRVLIVGDGSDRTRLKKLTHDLGLDHKVIFAGRQPNSSIWTWYRALDAMVVPRHDTLVTRTVTPIKSLAAQALHVPVIASDLPALREVTGEHAIFVPPDSPSHIAEAAINISEFDTSDAFAHAVDRSWSNIAERLRNTLSEIKR